MADYDLIIRGGEIHDGLGGPGFVGDVAIKDGRIAAVGKVEGKAREEIDAAGRIVTPGFVDIHTHYDGQATWEHRMAPSSNHGVTSVVMGNCGVGFAPCRPEQHDMLVELMEGVEDIPEVVMTTGLPWNWETFPEYLDALDQRQQLFFVGVQAGGQLAGLGPVQQVARGGHAHGPGADRLGGERAHLRQVGGGGRLAPRAAFAHHIDPQRRVRQLGRHVDVQPALVQRI